jgi:hypothetical protein
MKRLFLVYFFTSTILIVKGQSSVFVLVDVSKSVTQSQLTDARQALIEVLVGTPLTKAFISQGTSHDLANFKLVIGDKLSVSKFGGLQTTLSINPNIIQIQNPATDVSRVLNSTSWTPTDNQTYIQLAKAKIAEYAKNHKIAQYKLYIISDNVQDDYGPGGKPNYPDDYTRNLAEGYNTSTNQVNEQGYTKIKFAPNSLFTLSFSPNVDVSKYTLPGNVNLPITSDANTPAAIVLTSFADGKKDRPKSTNENSFNISWSCNCQKDVKFNVALTEIEGGKYRDSKKNVTSNSIRFSDVPSGKFKVVVSALNANSAMTYIETPSSGAGWIIALLLIAVAGGTGYYFWNKKRQEKIDVFASNKTDDIFSKPGGGTTPNSSNTDYF